jgi:hypothetical protein
VDSETGEPRHTPTHSQSLEFEDEDEPEEEEEQGPEEQGDR